MARGEVLGAFALTEPGSGSDAAALTTRAESDGSGGYRLHGRKQWVTNGGFAGRLLVFARSEPDPGARGITAFVVDAPAEGLVVEGEAQKLGLHASSTVDLALEGVRVPVGATPRRARRGLPRRDDDARRRAHHDRRPGRRHRPGGARPRRRRTPASAQAFGQPIGRHGQVAARLADCATELDAARLLTYRAAALRDAGKPHTAEGAKAKLFASGVARRADRLGDPGARRLRLHARLPGRALLPRRQGDRDLRGHERDPAPRDRPRAAGARDRHGARHRRRLRASARPSPRGSPPRATPSPASTSTRPPGVRAGRRAIARRRAAGGRRATAQGAAARGRRVRRHLPRRARARPRGAARSRPLRPHARRQPAGQLQPAAPGRGGDERQRAPTRTGSAA